MLTKTIQYSIAILLLLVLQQKDISAQYEDWNKQTSKDGKVVVLSNFSEEKDEDGNEVQIMEYIATTTADLTLDQCIKMMSNVSLQKDFYKDTEECIVLDTLSDNEWIIYYYIDSSWPLPDSDSVCKMTFTENKEEKTAIYHIDAIEGKYEMKDVRRMKISNNTYTFKVVGDNKVSVEFHSRFSPVVNAPQWLVKTWFPDGPVEIIENIVALSAKQ